MARMVVLLAAAAVGLAGCGGSGGGAAAGAPAGAGGKGGGDWKGKMGDLMKPCAEASKEATAIVGSYKQHKATQGEAIEAADAAVAACEKAHADWQGLGIPAEAQACVDEANERLQGAYAIRAALNHDVSAPYKKRMDRHVERAKRAEAGCKKAKTAAK